MLIRFVPICLVALVVTAVVAAVAEGTLFFWHDHVRPPVSLERALEIAKEQLGDDYQNRYCVAVQLFGNPYAQPRPGAWNLYFAATDGSKKQVYVDMDGNARVSVWNEAIDWDAHRGYREDIDDIRKRLEAFFAKEGLEVTFDGSGEGLLVSYRTRTFQMHKRDESGEFRDDLVEVTGPNVDGFIIELTESDFETRLKQTREAYWVTEDVTYPLQKEGAFVRVRVQRGLAFKREYELQLSQIFGL